MVPGFGVPMSDIQTDMRIENGYIYGTLKYCENVTAIDGTMSGYFMLINPYVEGTDWCVLATANAKPQGTPFTPINYYGEPYNAVRDGKDFVIVIRVCSEAEQFVPINVSITMAYGDPENYELATRSCNVSADTITLEPQE